MISASRTEPEILADLNLSETTVIKAGNFRVSFEPDGGKILVELGVPGNSKRIGAWRSVRSQQARRNAITAAIAELHLKRRKVA